MERIEPLLLLLINGIFIMNLYWFEIRIEWYNDNL